MEKLFTDVLPVPGCIMMASFSIISNITTRQLYLILQFVSVEIQIISLSKLDDLPDSEMHNTNTASSDTFSA